jgi:hypothetical protein
MMRFENPQVKEEFEAAFGIKSEDMTPAQVMFLVKYSKHVRGRCKSNAALKNYLIRCFPQMQFSEVDREWKGKTYKSLQITVKAKKDVPAAVETGDEE